MFVFLTCCVGVDDVMAGGRQRWVEESRKRHCDHVLLPERVVPPVHDRVVRLFHGPRHKKEPASQKHVLLKKFKWIGRTSVVGGGANAARFDVESFAAGAGIK